MGGEADRMARKQGASRRRTPKTGLALLCCALLAASLYVLGGVKEYRGSQGSRAEAAQSRALLKDMQAQTPIDLDAERNRQYRQMLDERGGIVIDDIEAEQQKILNLTEWNKAELARWFDNTAIVGDSIVKELRGYGWLDAPVFAKGGIHLRPQLAILDEIEAAQPKVIFLCFGMNDVGTFRQQVNLYVERYTQVIQRLQANIPGVIIYVHATLPVTEGCIKKEPHYKYIDLYNAEMEKVCPELGVYFIDSGFILKNKPELYSPDGRHPRKNYFPLWLTYLADMTGLNDTND